MLNLTPEQTIILATLVMPVTASLLWALLTSLAHEIARRRDGGDSR